MAAGDDSEDAQRASLYRVYQHALALRLREGKDLLLRRQTSNAVETKDRQDAIMYNRTLMQLALAAFALGNMQECNEIMDSVWTFRSDDRKEARRPDSISVLLGQKKAQPSKDNEEGEMVYYDLLVSPHFHIDFEHIELAAYISAMVVDTIAEARRPYDRQNRSVYFRKIVTQQIYQPLIGEPTTTREAILASFAALKQGDYKSSWSVLQSLPAWNKIPHRSAVQANVELRFKEEALKIFLMSFACSINSISLKQLCDRYELPPADVKAIVNQLLLDKDSPIVAFWSSDEAVLFVERGNTTRLQHLVDVATDKILDLSRAAGTGFKRYTGRGRGRGRR
jgi:hypothetical protein